MEATLPAMLSPLCKTDEDRQILSELEAELSELDTDGEIAFFENGQRWPSSRTKAAVGCLSNR